MKELLLLYIIIVNIYVLLIMKVDKSRAIKQKWRIPENRIFLIASVGGASGVWAGMRLFSHKTKHKTFTIGIPLLFLLNGGIVFLFLKLF